MAVALDTSVTDVDLVGGSSRTKSMTIGNIANGFLLVWVTWTTGTNVSVTSMTYGPDSMTKKRNFNTGEPIRAELWYLVGPATGTNNIVINFQETGQARSIIASSWSGVDDNNPMGTEQVAAGGSTHAQVTGITADDITVDFVTTDVTGWTQDGSQVFVNSQTSQRVAYHSYLAGGSSMGWTRGGAGSWGILGLALKAKVAAAPTGVMAGSSNIIRLRKRAWWG